jgi:hypothetical protein
MCAHVPLAELEPYATRLLLDAKSHSAIENLVVGLVSLRLSVLSKIAVSKSTV